MRQKSSRGESPQALVGRDTGVTEKARTPADDSSGWRSSLMRGGHLLLPLEEMGDSSQVPTSRELKRGPGRGETYQAASEIDPHVHRARAGPA